MMETRRGLTYKETLVAVAVGLVVFVVVAVARIPQFGKDCPPRTMQNRIRTDIQTVRCMIELYKIQHDDKLPGDTKGVGFVEALMLRTDANGVLVREDGFGPYLQHFPTNERNGLVTVEIDGRLGGGDYGWHYDTKTGEFHADTDEDMVY